jgi:hypothetical protein
MEAAMILTRNTWMLVHRYAGLFPLHSGQAFGLVGRVIVCLADIFTRLDRPSPRHTSRPMPKMIRKADLPAKTCASCGKPFTWRRKWQKVWDQVRYCSDRCRTTKRP